MAALIGMSGDFKGQTYQIDRDEITMGRSKDNVVVVEHPTVSGHHCCVVRRGDQYFLKDLESTNGTRLNSREVQESQLRPKDLIQVGSVEFMFDAEQTLADSDAYTETNVEIAVGPMAAPDTFASISPFGARRQETRSFWNTLIVVVGILAVLSLGAYLFTLITTG